MAGSYEKALVEQANDRERAALRRQGLTSDEADIRMLRDDMSRG